jgi:hypothetical protein
MHSRIRLLLFFPLTILFPVVFRGTVLAAGFEVTGSAIDNKSDPVAHAVILL